MIKISPERAHAFFLDIEPYLKRIAAGFKHSDPAGEARSWYARYIDIIEGFNSGTLTPKGFSEDSDLTVLTSQDDLDKFLRALQPYMATAFRNHLIRSSTVSSRHVPYGDMATTGSYSAGHSVAADIPADEAITLSDLISIIRSDLERKNRVASSPSEHEVAVFLKVLLKYYTTMFEKYGNIPIVKDINAEDAGAFFIYDIKDGRMEAIITNIKELAQTSTVRNELLACKSMMQLKSLSINKRISRYFNKNAGGMPARLKKLKKWDD